MLLYEDETLEECIQDTKKGHWNPTKQLDALVTMEDYVELSIVGGGGSVDFRPKLAKMGLLDSLVNAISSKSIEVQRQALWLLAMMTRSDKIAMQVVEHPELHKNLLSLLSGWQHLDDSRTPLLMALSHIFRARAEYGTGNVDGGALSVGDLHQLDSFKHIGGMLNGALLSIFSAHGHGEIRVTTPQQQYWQYSDGSNEPCPDCGGEHGSADVAPQADEQHGRQLRALLKELHDHGFGEQDTMQLLTFVYQLAVTEDLAMPLLEANSTCLQCLHHIAVETQDDEPEVSMLAAAALHALMVHLIGAEANGNILIVPDPLPEQDAGAQGKTTKSKHTKKKKRAAKTEEDTEEDTPVLTEPVVERGGPTRISHSQWETAKWLNVHQDARDAGGRMVGIPLTMEPDHMLLARTALTGAAVGFLWGMLRGFIGPKTPSAVPMACAVRWAQKAGPIRGAIIAALGTSAMTALLASANRVALVQRDRYFHEPNDQMQIATVATELLLESMALLLCLRVAPYSFWPAVGTVVWEQDDGGF
jgi:hypothetical protein